MSQRDEPNPELVKAVIRADAEALGHWFANEHPIVYRLCTGFLADRTEAEDAAQDAMLHLRDNLISWDPQRPYRAWRNRVVLNICRDHMRRMDARRRAESGGAEQYSQAPPAPSPIEQLQQRETMELLESSLRSLSRREREVFVLRDLEQVDTSEVSLSLGISASSVRSLLTLARRRLRDLMRDHVNPSPIGGSHG